MLMLDERAGFVMDCEIILGFCGYDFLTIFASAFCPTGSGSVQWGPEKPD